MKTTNTILLLLLSTLLIANTNSLIFVLKDTQDYCYRLNTYVVHSKKFEMKVLATFEDASETQSVQIVFTNETLLNQSAAPVSGQQPQESLIIDTRIGPSEKEERTFKHDLNEKDTYLLCFIGFGEGEKHVIIDFPELNAFDAMHKEELTSTIDSLKELYELSNKAYTSMTMRLQKFMAYDKMLYKIEKYAANGFYVKAGVLFFITLLQACVFYKLIDQKIQDFKRISLPI